MSNPIDKLSVTYTHLEAINRAMSEKHAWVISSTDKGVTQYEVKVYDSLIQKGWAYFVGIFTPGKSYLYRSEAKSILILQLKKEFDIFANSLNVKNETPSLKFIMKTVGESNETTTLKKIGDYQNLITKISELFVKANTLNHQEITAKVSNALDQFSKIVSTMLVIKNDIREISESIDSADAGELRLTQSELSVLRGRAAAIKTSINPDDHAKIVKDIEEVVQKLQERESSLKAQTAVAPKTQSAKSETSTIETIKNQFIHSIKETNIGYLFLSNSNVYLKELTDLAKKPNLSDSDKEKIDESIKELESVIKEKFNEIYKEDNLVKMKIILSEAKRNNSVDFLKNIITEKMTHILEKMFEDVDENSSLEHLEGLVWTCKDLTEFEELSSELNGRKQKLHAVLDGLTRDIEQEQQKLSASKPTFTSDMSIGDASAEAEKLVGSIKDSYFKGSLVEIFNNIDDFDEQLISKLEKECLSDLQVLERREPRSQRTEDRRQVKLAIDSLKTLYSKTLKQEEDKKKFAESTKTYDASMKKLNSQKLRIDGIRTDLS